MFSWSATAAAPSRKPRKLDGVRKVLLAEAPHLAQRLAEETAAGASR